MPVLENVLAGETSGFSENQIQALIMVHWQSFLLGETADAMKLTLEQSFTIQDPENHSRVLGNHRMYIDSYGRRTRTLLRTIRAALRELRQESSQKRPPRLGGQNER